jgi:hypothetical protein
VAQATIDHFQQMLQFTRANEVASVHILPSLESCFLCRQACLLQSYKVLQVPVEQVKDLICATQTRKVCTSQQTNMSFSKVVHRRGTCGKSFGPDHAYIGSLLTSGWSPVVCIGLPNDVHDSLICGSDSCGCPVGKGKIWSNFIKTRCR